MRKNYYVWFKGIGAERNWGIFFFFFSFVWLGGSEKGIKNEGFSFPPNPLFLFLPKYCGIEREGEC